MAAPATAETVTPRSVSDQLGIASAVRAVLTGRRAAVRYIRHRASGKCTTWGRADPVPPEYEAISYATYRACTDTRKPLEITPGKGGPSALTESTSPSRALSTSEAERAAREALAQERARLHIARTPRPPRPPRAPRPPRKPRAPRPPRKPRAPRAPRAARPPRPARPARRFGNPGFWWCKVNTLLSGIKVMAGPHWSADPVGPGAAAVASGAYIPVPSPFVCHGESCDGTLAPFLKKAQELLLSSYQVTTPEIEAAKARTQARYGGAPGPRPAGGESRRGKDVQGTSEATPAGKVCWFTTANAGPDYTGPKQFVASPSFQPWVVFGGQPFYFSYRACDTPSGPVVD